MQHQRHARPLCTVHAMQNGKYMKVLYVSLCNIMIYYVYLCIFAHHLLNVAEHNQWNPVESGGGGRMAGKATEGGRVHDQAGQQSESK